MADVDEVRTILDGPMTKSDKIRALNRRGMPRARIAEALGVKYQFVRNVLEADRVKERGGPEVSQGVGEAAPQYEGRIGNLFRLRVQPGGVIRLPQEVLAALELREGAIVVADLEGDTLTLIGPQETLRRVRAIIPQWRPGEPMWSEQLIEERRREQAKEDAGG